MTVREAIFARRAVRDFTDTPVPEVAVRRMLEAAVQAPSALNRQPWAFVVVQDKALLEEISDYAKELLVQTDAFHHFAAELRRELEKADFNIFYNAGTLVVVCAAPGGAHPDWDACLAGENLMLEALEMGYATCVIGFAWGALESDDVRRRLGIPGDFQPVLPIVVGQPRELPSSPGRREPRVLTWVTSREAVKAGV